MRVEHTVRDAHFGAVTIAAGEGADGEGAGETGEGAGETAWVSVSGAHLPTAHIARRGTLAESRSSSTPPIGTRDPGLLHARLDGSDVHLEIGAGRLARSSFRVRARRDTTWWTLTPSDPHSSRLVLGRRYAGNNESAVLTRGADGSVGLAWTDPVRLGRLRADAPAPTPESAAIGYLLAAAFDTGAELAIVRLFTEGTDLLLPG